MRWLLTSVVAGLTAFGAAAQGSPERPRLVVGIVVDQLRTDYIEQLRSYFGEKGFRTLLGDGVYMRDVEFNATPLDAINSTALIYTGAYPSNTGVPAAAVYDAEALPSGLRLPLADKGSVSLTNDSFTPANLQLSTIADEIAINGGGFAQIYSVAIDPQQAVIMAGHAANGAIWLNNASGNWATSSYYGSLPSSISSRNYRNCLRERIDTMQWRPSAQLRLVADLPEWKKRAPFRHSFTRQDRDIFKKFANTPLSNAEVTDIATDLLRNLNLGKNPQATDMLNVAYTLAPYKYGTDGAARAELTDAYLRLDSQLGKLFEAIEKAVGKENALIWLTSTGYCDEATADDKRFRIPGGEFSVKRARSLLNSYLSAKYGAASYVESIRESQVHFNKNTLESGGRNASAIINDARAFLLKMSGISDALTLDEILLANTPETKSLRNTLDPRNSGEIILQYTPGWTVNYDEQIPSVSKQVRASAVMTPAFILGTEFAPQIIETPVEAVAIAPTIAGAMRIRAPNGAASRQIALCRKK